jgi:mRNA-degrading endonuclease toxin of MazEF toxin-antitoxin module
VSKRAFPVPNSRFDALDIVVVPLPYADRLAEKRRPALVISNRKLAPFG